MPESKPDKRNHLVLKGTSEGIAFTARSSGGNSAPVPTRDRQSHGSTLKNQLQELKPIAQAAANAQSERGFESGIGLQIEFIGQPDVELAFESLANAPKKIELLSIRTLNNLTVANVFVPDGQLDHFEKYILEYLEDRKGEKGQSLDHKALINTIASIRSTELRALWTDDLELFPEDPSEVFWWEIWLPVRGERQTVVNDFRKLAAFAGCEVSTHQSNFPERTIVLMYGSQNQLEQSIMLLNCVAELRRAKDTAEFFDGMKVEDQGSWMSQLLASAQFPSPQDKVPFICLLDSGVNRGHPMLQPLIETQDLHTVEPAWGVDDAANHGTGLAGLAAYGDMTPVLAKSGPVTISHRLESVKLTPTDGANLGDAKHHAYLFSKAVAYPEILEPDRSRVFTSAVTASDYRDRGRPSSWSSMVDSLAADVVGGAEFPRLFILAAGNTGDHDAWMSYPDSLSTNLIHDPGQSWNAITVGAFTEKTETEILSLAPIAHAGGLSPYTTTSRTWDSAWPLKPDVVFEGGNVGQDDRGAVGAPSLNLLTTNHVPNESLFTTTNATSAASALCARMAAQIKSAYPNLRPETLRALIVHSAEWTDAMKQMYLSAAGKPTKQNYVHLIRHCGWGAPEIDRALWSAGNSLTLIVEDVVHPYKKDASKVITRDMNLHAIPWPKEELEALQDVKVQMRVTLSYFIEPNPSARGTNSKYHYPSHRLRFDVKRSLESSEDFVARINAAIQQEEDGASVSSKDTDWYLGDRQRHRGSIHQDVWEGTAADLASRGFVAVYPGMGWWRTRKSLARYALPAKYSLIISIKTEQTDIDLYNVIANKVGIIV